MIAATRLLLLLLLLQSKSDVHDDVHADGDLVAAAADVFESISGGKSVGGEVGKGFDSGED